MPTGTKYRRSPGERRPTGQPIELEVQGAAYGGRMVARPQGRVIFVQGGIPGETVRAELTLEKPSFAEAQATKLVQPTGSRVVPPCIYFGENGHNRGPLPSGNALPGQRLTCGGCQYQHMDYAAQLEMKRDIVADLVHRQGRLPDVQVLETIASPSPWQYRNRARWIVDDDGLLCYHQAASERLLPVGLCHIVQPLIEDILKRLSNDAWRLPLRTLVGEITARTAVPWSNPDDEQAPAPVVMLVLHPRPGAKRRDMRMLADDLGAAIPGLSGIVMAPHKTGPGGPLWGARFLDARFAGYRFRLSPLTFFQVNEPAAELMVERIMSLLGDIAGKSVLDVYAGAGALTFPIAARAEQVLAMETDAQSVEDATYSAHANGLRNVHLLPGDAADELAGLPRNAADVAVLDPPRAGLHERVVDELTRIEMARIIYVSCDPATLARDLRRFTERGYGVTTVQPIDLFPQTFHVETIAVLHKR